MKTNGWLLALGLLSSTAAGTALAQERGLYLGGSVGDAQYQNICNGFDTGAACNDGDTGFRVFGGYQFNRNAALELGYVDLGTVDAQGSVAGTPTTVRSEGNGFDLSGLISFPVAAGLSVFGRLGIYYIRSQVDVTAGGVTSESHTNGGFLVGAGIGFDLWKFGVRAEWQRYDSAVGGGSVGEDDVNFFSVGALLRF